MKDGPRIILVSGWQCANIGDIAHTAGMLALLERELSGVQVSVWPFKALSTAFMPSLVRRFPNVTFLPPFEPARSTTEASVLRAIDESDFLLHASGPATLGWRQCEAFADRTNRGFGIFGVTYGLYGVPERATLDRADFVLFRDTPSFEAARRDAVATTMGVTADCAFAFDMRDDGRANSFLERHQLKSGEFVCALARLRHTPFWQMPGHDVDIDPAKLRENEESSETLTAPILEAVIRVVRNTPMKVLLCPEDLTQIAVTRQWIYDRLPEDVRPRVVWRETFWMPDEAASVYAMSAGVFGSEQHSPIFAIGSGVPAMVARWSTQSTKGFMWRDIGLHDWLFDFDDAAQREAFPAKVLDLVSNGVPSIDRAADARSRVHATQSDAVRMVGKCIERGD